MVVSLFDISANGNMTFAYIMTFHRTKYQSIISITHCLRARSQIPVYGLTGRSLGSQSAALGAGFCGQNLGIKYIP